ncbi:MAG: aldo/keto reductase [Opitutales bacterium]
MTTPPKLRWGILGPGRIAHKLAAGLAASETSDLVAVGSRNLERAIEFARQHGDHVRAHGSYEALLDDAQVDVIYIATPHPYHAQQAVMCARAGKHILCEKPAAMNRHETEVILDVCREHDVFFMEAFMYRCYPQTAALIEALRRGDIGRPKFFSGHFCFDQGPDSEGRHQKKELGGGAILDIGCYPVSFARLVAGVAEGKPFAEPTRIGAAGHLGETGVDEWTACVLSFASGLVAETSCAIRLNRENHVTIYGEEGRLVVPNPWFGEGRYLHYKGDAQEPAEIKVGEPRARYLYEVDTVVRYLDARQAAAPTMSWDDSLGNMAVLDKWRAQIGLRYDLETRGPGVPTIDLGPVRKRSSVPHPMPYAKLPGVALDCSRVIMGALGSSFAGNSYLWDAFFEFGGNAWDTAAMYSHGESERNLGQWIENRGLRDEVVIITKGAHSPKNWPQLMPDEFAGSLERLRTDRIEVYMMHRDNTEVPVGEFIDVMAGWQQAGQVGTYGFSNWTVERMRAAINYAQANALPLPGVVSNNLSLARMVDPVWQGVLSAKEAEYHAFLLESGLNLLPWSSQARGFFTERSGPDKHADPELVRCWYSEDNFQRKARAAELAAKKGVSTLNIALAWVLHQAYPCFPLVGPANRHELRTLLPALTVELTPDEFSWLDLQA